MEISILYSKDKAAHVRTVSFIRKAVKNLGISARITEQETGMSFPRVMVDGFDIFNNLGEEVKNHPAEIPYKVIEKALERSAWTGF